MNTKKTLILLFLFIVSSTALSVDEEQADDKVGVLPGQLFNVSFAHYSGYITVDENSGKALFYWFFEAAEDPDSKPLLLWLNGGPGCSSIGYGLAEEIGPLHIKADGKTLYLNPYSWNQVANVIFLDSPVGVGYSYSNNSQDVYNNGDESTAKDSLAFLEGWFKRYPKYQGREFYIVGESYGGHYVPQLSQAIVRSQKSGEKLINLKGYMVGNGLTDDYYDHIGVFEFLWAAGLISDQTYKLLNLNCDFESFIHPSSKCNETLDVANEEIGNIDPYSIYTPSCLASATLSRNKVFKRLYKVGRIGENYDPCTAEYATVYFNLPEVKRALHVHPNVASSTWETCNQAIYNNWKDAQSSMLDIYHELIREGLRIWIFSGDTDSVLPVTGTRYNINALKLSTVTPWHAWYLNGQVGGWTQVYDGLTFVIVRGAGHEVPLHRPQHALVLFKSFLTGSPMPTLTEVISS